MTIPTFPSLVGIAYPVKRTPIWQTIHQEALSGRDTPLPLRTYPQRRYQLQYDFLRKDATRSWAELQTLEGFYNQMNGSYGVFQYLDPDDGVATLEQFGIGAVGVTTFQLARTWGGFVEPVWQPSAITQITNAGVPTVAYTIGTNPGQIIFNVAPTAGNILRWTGTFNWLCRFDDDTNDFEKFMYWLWELKQVKFTTIKMP